MCTRIERAGLRARRRRRRVVRLIDISGGGQQRTRVIEFPKYPVPSRSSVFLRLPFARARPRRHCAVTTAARRTPAIHRRHAA